MEFLYAGLDVRKNSVIACVLQMADGKIASEVKTFTTGFRPFGRL
jgi:hypothetical protein